MFSPKQYTVLKFSMNYIVANGYDIRLSKSEQVPFEIRQADNMLFRHIRHITGDNGRFNQYVIFVDCSGGQNHPEIVRKLVTEGFDVNLHHYVASERSASMVRMSILCFVADIVAPDLNDRVTMEISFDKTVLSKYYAYRGLMLSSCHILEDWYPKIIVVPDYYITIPDQHIKYAYDRETTFIDDDTGHERTWVQKDITSGTRDITINAFDGCGICAPEIMQEIQRRIGTSDHMNTIIIRGPYIKGAICSIDYVSFFAERGVTTITDIWGVAHDVTPGSMPMIILTEGQYKGYKYFNRTGTIDDWNRYWELFRKYDHCLGVAKWNFDADREPLQTRVNYQVLQDLDLPFEEFKQLAAPSIDWYEKIINGDPIYTYCFLGLYADDCNPMTHYAAAVVRNPEMLKDPSIRDYLRNLTESYKDQFKCGKLWMDATFKFWIPDLIALMEHIGGLPVVGCLEAGEFYSSDRRGIMTGERIIERNPHICKSEHVIANAVHNDLTDRYCSHLQNVAMINIKSITAQRLNGSDFDGDLVCVINNPIMMKGIDRNAAITIDIEDKVTALAEPDDEYHRVGYTIRSLKNMIGEISNYATAYHNKCPKSDITKAKYESCIDLLSICNGKAIDMPKTGVLYPIPINISRHGRPLPYFMKYAGDYYSKLGKLSKAHSNMNMLCIMLERWEYSVKYKPAKSFDWHIMYDESIGYSQKHFDKIEEVFLDFNKLRNKQLDFEKKCHNWKLFHKQIEDKISRQDAKEYHTNWQQIYDTYRTKCKFICPDNRELANILVILSFEKYPSKYKKFMWQMAGDGIVQNIKSVDIQLPIHSSNGKYEYLGQKYDLAPPAKYDSTIFHNSVIANDDMDYYDNITYDD